MADSTSSSGPALALSSDSLRTLADHVDLQQRCGGGALAEGSCFDLGLPRQDDGSALGRLKTQLERYIDFDAGGAKLVTFDVQGKPASFLLTPSFSDGLSIKLQFVVKF